jgi:hypothetical protein
VRERSQSDHYDPYDAADPYDDDPSGADPYGASS